MTVALTIVIVLFAAFLLVRLRVRVEISPERRTLFVGLGRTGPEVDFINREIRIRLSGFSVKRFSLDHPERHAKIVAPEKRLTPRAAKDTKPSRRRSVSMALQALPQGLNAMWKYFVGLLKATIIERAEGEIEAGFSAPHITGQVYGCYQMALAAVPALAGRFQFVPVWTGPSFSGRLNVCIAWPVYRLAWQTALLVWRLPKRKLYKLAIGEKKGVQYVKQRG